MIQFSFDDCHELNYKLFDLMKQYDYPVIWFIDFRRPRMASFQIKKFAEKHEIGNHTMNHPLLTRIDFKQVDDEVREADRKIEELIGTKPTSFCPPRGYTNDIINRFVKAEGYKNIRLNSRSIYTGCDNQGGFGENG